MQFSLFSTGTVTIKYIDLCSKFGMNTKKKGILLGGYEFDGESLMSAVSGPWEWSCGDILE